MEGAIVATIAEAFFPRFASAAKDGGGLGRLALARTLDVASLPGRAYSSLLHRYDEPMLDNMARTGVTPDMSTAASVAEGMARDPLTLLSAPIGGFAAGAGRAIASKASSEIMKRILPLLADAAANTGAQAVAQYGTEGRVDPGALAANAGLGLGMQGMGSAVAKMAPKARPHWSSDQNAAAVERYGNKEDAKEILDRLKSWTEKGKKYKSIPASEIGYLSADEIDALLPPINSVEERFWKAGYEGKDPPILARGWRYGKPENPNTSWNFQDQRAEPGVSAMQAFTDENPNVLGGSYEMFNGKNNKRTIEGWLDRSATGGDGEPLFTGVRDLGTYPHPDPNFQYLAGGQSPIAGANALAGKYFRGVANGSNGEPVVTDQKQYDALPAGASYRDASGRPHIKGGAK